MTVSPDTGSLYALESGGPFISPPGGPGNPRALTKVLTFDAGNIMAVGHHPGKAVELPHLQRHYYGLGSEQGRH